MPPIRLPTLPPTGGLDFAPVPEGESGLDIQISPGRMGGGGNTFDTAIAGAELQSSQIYFNFTITPAMATNPAFYAGTFMTDFSGQLLAGRRLDGVQPTPPATAWNTANPFNIATGSVVRAGTNNDIKIISGAAIGAPNIYSPGGGIGLDIFHTPAAFPGALYVSINNFPNYTGGAITIDLFEFGTGIPIIVNNPQIVVPGYNNISVPNVPIKTRPRPEGYLPGETGLQIFWSNLSAVSPQPPGFNPVPPGFPYWNPTANVGPIPRFVWGRI